MTTAHRPAPHRGVFDEPYWSYAAAGELRLPRCTACGSLRYPPGPVCPECLAADHEWAALSGRGSLLAWTVFHRQYFPGIPAPYTVAAVRTAEGPILIGNIVGIAPAELRHDMPLAAVFEDVTTTTGETLRICQWTRADSPHIEEPE